MPVDFIIGGVMFGIGGLGLLLMSALSDSPTVKIGAHIILLAGIAAVYFS